MSKHILVFNQSLIFFQFNAMFVGRYNLGQWKDMFVDIIQKIVLTGGPALMELVGDLFKKAFTVRFTCSSSCVVYLVLCRAPNII